MIRVPGFFQAKKIFFSDDGIEIPDSMIVVEQGQLCLLLSNCLLPLNQIDYPQVPWTVLVCLLRSFNTAHCLSQFHSARIVEDRYNVSSSRTEYCQIDEFKD